MRMTDEPCGGDPPCWAHLFEEEAGQPSEADAAHGRDAPVASGTGTDDGGVVDLVTVSRSVAGRGPAWTRRSEDLDTNLLVFGAGEGVAEHVNAEVDVLLVGIAGEGAVAIDARHVPLRPGQVILVPKGARRATRGLGDRFAYLTCHRRRAGLRPSRERRPASEPGANLTGPP